jgi:hypothetical protein
MCTFVPVKQVNWVVICERYQCGTAAASASVLVLLYWWSKLTEE